MDREAREEPSGDGAEPAADNNPTQPDTPEQPADTPPERRVPPVNRALGRLERRLGGRPLGLYGVLAAGIAVLLILLAVIWFTAGDDGGGEAPICLDIDVAEAVARIEDGEAEQISVIYPERPGSTANNGDVPPAALQLAFTDDFCRNLKPQGPNGKDVMYTVLGAAAWYNSTTDQRRIKIDVSESNSIPPEVLATSTPTPSPTVPVTETPTEVATPLPEPTTTIAPTATAPAVGSPSASPEVATPGA